MFTAALRQVSTRSSLRVPVNSLAWRGMASGPSEGGHISDELLAKLGTLSTQALVDGLWVMGWPNAQIDGSRALHPSHKCVGRAVTLQFVPARPDIAQSKPAGGESPEYEAFEKCGPNEVRVVCELRLLIHSQKIHEIFNTLLLISSKFGRFILLHKVVFLSNFSDWLIFFKLESGFGYGVCWKMGLCRR